MSSIQFMSKAEYRDTISGGVVFYKYPMLFNCDSKLSKTAVLQFLAKCKKLLGTSNKEFNKLYMVESNSKGMLNTFTYIFNDIGYAIEPIKLGGDTMIIEECSVYTK